MLDLIRSRGDDLQVQEHAIAALDGEPDAEVRALEAQRDVRRLVVIADFER